MERKKRILIVLSNLCPGGMSQYVINLATILSTEFSVNILSTHGKGSLDNGLPVYIDHLIVSSKNTLGRYAAVLKCIRDYAPDIIINNYNATLKYLSPLIPFKIKIVDVLHSDDLRFYKIGRINAWRNDGWIAPSPRIKEQFSKFLSLKYRDRIQVIPHGVRHSDIEPKKNRNAISLIFVGTFFHYKGVRQLPEIVHKLSLKGIDWTLTLIGDGIEWEYVRAELAKDISEGRVEMFRQLPSSDVYAKMAASDCLLFPSCLEAFGLVVVEAMMNSTVPIVARIDGVMDYIIEENVSGIIVDKQTDVDAFVNAIELLSCNRDLMEKMQQHSRNRALEMFSLTNMQKQYSTYLK